MGREVKRVTLDFNHPMNEVWPGYLMPDLPESLVSKECPQCLGDGYNPATARISDAWYSLGKSEWVWISESYRYNNLAWQYHITEDEVTTLAANGELRDFTHIFIKGEGWKLKSPPYTPTAEEVNKRSRSGGFQILSQYACVKIRAQRLGVWGYCLYCKGEGIIYKSILHKWIANWRDNHWKPTEPPKGEGYQMWEDTSEGSPISPVFDTPEKLAHWLASTNASAFGYEGATYEQWLRVCNGGYAPSAVIDKGGIKSGVAGLNENTH